MEHQQGWSIRLAAEIGRNVAYHRGVRPGAKGRRMTVQALADRCTELGLPIGRVALTKLENGVREKVSVAEIFVLAAALEVPPVLLIFPLGRTDSVEIIPARTLSAWDAAKWLSGDARLQDGPGAVPATTTSAVPLHREHDRLTYALAGTTKESLLHAEPGDPSRRFLPLAVGALRSVREFIRELGLEPPALPAGLAWIDELGG